MNSNIAKLSPSSSSAGLRLALFLVSPTPPPPPPGKVPKLEIQARYEWKTLVSLIGNGSQLLL